MKSLLLALVCLLVSPPVLADGDWTICWTDKVAGVDAFGHKIMCKKCYSRPGLPPSPGGANCKYFRFEFDASDWWKQNCDCP